MGTVGSVGHAAVPARGPQGNNTFRWWACGFSFVFQTALVATWTVPALQQLDNRVRLVLALAGMLALVSVLVPEGCRRVWRKVLPRLQEWFWVQMTRSRDEPTDEPDGPRSS